MHANLDLKELLLGDINRLRYLKRFGNSLVVHRENVAEHSFYVAMYGYWLCEWCWNNNRVFPNIGTVLIRALFHDADEARTGDFQRPFKYSSPELKAAIDKAAKTEFRMVIHPILSSSEAHEEALTQMWDNAKDNSIEGCVVALADFLSVLSHMWQEINCANATMLKHHTTMIAYLRTFDAKEYDFLRPVIRQVEAIVETVLVQPNNDLREQFSVPVVDEVA